MKKIKNIVLFLFVMASSTGYSQCVEGNCIDGFGIFKCSCGYTYEGEFKNGEKVNGILTKEDLVYTGEFKNDVAEGQGVIKFIDSTWYEGSFVNNFPEGYGVFHFADGTTYTGEMMEGKFKGIGVMKYPEIEKGHVFFKVGEFEEDELNGFGLISDSNTVFFGQLENGTPNGFGAFLVDSGVVVGGKVKKSKVIRKFDLQHDEEYVNFGSRPMKIGQELFWVEGNLHHSNLVIVKEDTDARKMWAYFSREKKWFFLSSFETAPFGEIIDLDGKIFKAKWNEKTAEPEIIENK